MTWQARVDAALALIGNVPGCTKTAAKLRRARIRYDPNLDDRAQVSWAGTLTLGLEPFAETGDAGLVSLAGTLAHEAYHLSQFPLLKTVSFWAGIAGRTHTMARYERPAYRFQAQFLDALAAVRPDLAELCACERDAALSSFAACYE